MHSLKRSLIREKGSTHCDASVRLLVADRDGCGTGSIAESIVHAGTASRELVAGPITTTTVAEADIVSGTEALGAR